MSFAQKPIGEAFCNLLAFEKQVSPPHLMISGYQAQEAEIATKYIKMPVIYIYIYIDIYIIYIYIYILIYIYIYVFVYYQGKSVSFPQKMMVTSKGTREGWDWLLQAPPVRILPPATALPPLGQAVAG